MTAQTLTAERTGRRLGPAAAGLLRQFPPRRPESSWSATEQSGEEVSARLLAPPFVLDAPGTQARRRAGIGKVLRWLEHYPGQTWQDRWLVSGADVAGNIAWRHRVIGWLRRDGAACAREKNDFDALGSAILVLISGDVIRPSLSWLLTPGTVQILTAEMARSRDPEGFAELVSVCRKDPTNTHTKNSALCRIATIMAAKGGMVRDITAGDCVEMAELLLGGGGVDTSAYFYQLLHAMGAFPDAAPSTVRAVSGQAQGQITVEQMIDRYDIACRPVRDVLVDYLRERQPSLDFTSLRALSFGLGKLFWKDLETHHLGIDSLRLAPDVAAGWKHRIARKTIRSKNSAGQVVEVESLRSDRGINYLAMVRAFYLDLAQWAMDDLTRWGVWAAPCPIRDEEMSRERTAPTVSHVSTSGPVSGCRSCRPWRTPSILSADWPRNGSQQLNSLPRARFSPPPDSSGAARQPRSRPPGSGPTIPKPANAAISAWRNIARSGPGLSWKSCGTPASESKSSPSCHITASCNTGCPTPASSSRCCTSPRPRPTPSGCYLLTEQRHAFALVDGLQPFGRLWSRPVMEDDERTRDLAMLAVPLAGAVEVTGDSWLPFRVTDPCGAVVESVSAYFRDLQAAGRSDATLRSYGMDLLRWFRFLWAVEVAWNRATRIEARDFCRWMLVSGKPSRPHWRRPHEVPDRSSTAVAYSASVRAHAETVLRGFYEFHLAAGSGPIVNPFPLHRSRRGGRAYAHHSPMESHRKERTGLYRPRVPSRIPRSIPDEEFNEIFARLPSNRDRALVAFYVSTGARASELLSATRGDVDPGRQVIALVRKGSRAVQELPASTDAFVWLRLYQVETEGLVPKGKRQPLWWTSRTPMRPLTYHAAHRMFERAAQRAGSAATLHALRHTAAYRMAEDPALPLTDVQCVLGHALLTTTQIYLTPRKEEVIRRVLAHHAEQTRQAAERARPAPAPGYRPETLKVLFGSPAMT